MANSVTITDSGASAVLSDEAMYAAVQTAITALVTTGVSYTIFGSRSVTRGNLPELYEIEGRYRRRLLRARGWTGQNLADMGGNVGSSSDNTID